MLVSTSAILIVFCFLKSGFCQQCPNFETMKGFDPTKYMGTWYEIRRSPTLLQADQKCVNATFTLTNTDTNTASVICSGVKIQGDQSVVQLTGSATISDPNDASKLTVNFQGLPPQQSNYWVLDTDYNTYSVVYSCLPFNGSLLKYSWILARGKTLDQTIIDRCSNLAANKGVDTSKFVNTPQDC